MDQVVSDMSPITNVRDFLSRAAGNQPGKIALVDHKRSVTYAELDDLVTRFTSGLLGLGLPRNARVALYLDKTIEFVATFLAVGSAGGIAVPINPKLKPTQVGHVLADCTPSLLVTTLYRLKQYLDLAGALDFPAVIVADTLPQSMDVSSIHLWTTLAESEPATAKRRPVDRDPAAILYTSGSTGLAKGVTLSHRNLVSGAESVNSYLHTSSEDTILALLPFSFDAGLSQLTTALAVGAKLVLLNYLRAQEAADICLREKVTSITGVPPLWTQISGAKWDSAARNRVRLFANTGGHMTPTLLGELRTLFPVAQPFLMYGLTEAFRSTYLDPHEVDRKMASIGKAIPNAEILVVRPDGSECDVDEPGELVHRGPHVALGYWNDEARTAERFRPYPGPAAGLATELAVWSGDIVRRDEEGFLYFIGRRDEMIKSSGYRISPTEVETVLVRHPMIGEAAVFGVPDAVLGQRVVAFVTSFSTTSIVNVQEVDAYCNRELPSYMIPEIRTVGELPRSANGKIDRGSLRTRYGNEAAQSEPA